MRASLFGANLGCGWVIFFELVLGADCCNHLQLWLQETGTMPPSPQWSDETDPVQYIEFVRWEKHGEPMTLWAVKKHASGWEVWYFGFRNHKKAFNTVVATTFYDSKNV